LSNQYKGSQSTSRPWSERTLLSIVSLITSLVVIGYGLLGDVVVTSWGLSTIVTIVLVVAIVVVGSGGGLWSRGFGGGISGRGRGRLLSTRVLSGSRGSARAVAVVSLVVVAVISVVLVIASLIASVLSVVSVIAIGVAVVLALIAITVSGIVAVVSVVSVIVTVVTIVAIVITVVAAVVVVIAIVSVISGLSSGRALADSCGRLLLGSAISLLRSSRLGGSRAVRVGGGLGLGSGRRSVRDRGRLGSRCRLCSSSRDGCRLGNSCRCSVRVGSRGGSIVVVVIVIVCLAGSLYGEVGAIFKSTVLSIADEGDLMVRGSVDRAHAVDTSGQAVGDGSSEDIILGSIVKALEEGKSGGVEGLGGLQIGHLLDGDVRVADEDTLVIDLLRSRVVVGLGVDKVTSDEVQDLHLDGEGLVLDEAFVSVLGEDKLAARSNVEADDTSHGCLAARAGGDLPPIGEWDTLVEGNETVVDARDQAIRIRYGNYTRTNSQVVDRGGRANLSGIWVVTLTILLQALRDDGRIKSYTYPGNSRLVSNRFLWLLMTISAE
jgi:hypothetical protein